MAKFFEPPTVDDVPPLLASLPRFPAGGPLRFYAHMKSRARGRTVILLTSGSCVTVDYPLQMVPTTQEEGDPFTQSGLAGYTNAQIRRVFLGGHRYPITEEEATLLTACGHGSRIEDTGLDPSGTWGMMETGTWDDWDGYEWGGIP